MIFLGIDIGGTNIATGVVDGEGNIIAKVKVKTKLDCPGDGLAEQLIGTIREVLHKAGATLGDLPFVGIGCPGTVNKDSGIIEFSNNIQHLNGFALKEYLERRIGKTVYIENDANAAAYGEYKAGALMGACNAVAITLGTGVGSGIIINGRIYSGSNFAGGELGHMVIVKDGRPCTCGRKGCWETYSSATGLIASTKEKLMKGAVSRTMHDLLKGDFDKIDGMTAFDAMRAGDTIGEEIVKEYIDFLACGITNCVNIFQPDKLCIGGGVSNEGETLLKPLRERVSEQIYSQYSEKQTEILKASLGNNAGIIGAALLGCQ